MNENLNCYAPGFAVAEDSVITDLSLRREQTTEPTLTSPRIAVPSGNRRHPPRIERQTAILVPFEPSTNSMAAIKTGLHIARQARAQLILCHAVHLNLIPYGPANPSRLKAALCEEAMAFATPIMMAAQDVGVSVICVIEEGAPATVIENSAARWGCRDDRDVESKTRNSRPLVRTANRRQSGGKSKMPRAGFAKLIDCKSIAAGNSQYS